MNSFSAPQEVRPSPKSVPEGDFRDTTLDAVDVGLIVLDRAGRVVRWNAWIESASAIAAETAHGRLLSEIYPSVEMKRLSGAVGAALETGSSSLLTHVLHPTVLPLRTRAGRPLRHDVMITAIGDHASRQCLIQITDVTMAAERERILRERQNARYDAVVESAPDVIITLDGEGTIQLANPAAVRQFGYAERELVGQQAAKLFDNEAEWDGLWRNVLRDGAVAHPVELAARGKDAQINFVEVSASRWRTDARIFVTVILRDINERRQKAAALRASEAQARAAADALAELNATLEQRVEERTRDLIAAQDALRQSQKMEAVGQLTGGIAHDFNNLLQGIIGALDTVQRRVAGGRIGDIDRFLKGAHESANRAAALTHRLLAFSRRQPVDPRPVDINNLTGTMEELLLRSVGPNVRIVVEGSADLWLVRCDANQLENALLNLAINARDAMPQGGALTIKTVNVVLDTSQALQRDVAPGEYVQLSVTDTGVGMPATVKARAFDPFYTTKPIGQGTGLGLSMVYGFVRQSDGAVRIQSEENRGTTIEICLPRFRGTLAAASDTVAAPGTVHANTDEVVLVVEDEGVVRLLVVEVLNDLGYHALEAGDGATALRILQSSQRIDLLVTDIGLPDINGRQLADAARAKRPKLKVLFMTGYAESAASSSFLDGGMEIAVKPFAMDFIAQRIRHMIERDF